MSDTAVLSPEEVIQPKSPHVLASTAAMKIFAQLHAWGFSTEQKGEIQDALTDAWMLGYNQNNE